MMNRDKICFICCANNEEQYKEARLYMEHQILPEGMRTEFRVVEGAVSMAAGYNAAMQSSDAKYKVYLHQDVFLRKMDAVKNCIALFREDESLGLLGLAGCRRLPSNGIWWYAQEKYGMVAQSVCPECIELTKFEEISAPLQRVQAVDGIFMMTQQDVPWREDLFAGWHFYDISACMEFARAGYGVGIPHQSEPWCVHETADKEMEDYEDWRAVFLREYGKEIDSMPSDMKS